MFSHLFSVIFLLSDGKKLILFFLFRQEKMALEEAFQQQVDKISKNWNIPREEVEQRFRASEPFPACLPEALALELDPASLAENPRDESFWKAKGAREFGTDLLCEIFPQKSWKEKYFRALQPHEIWCSDWTDLELEIWAQNLGIPRNLSRTSLMEAFSRSISLATLYTGSRTRIPMKFRTTYGVLFLRLPKEIWILDLTSQQLIELPSEIGRLDRLEELWLSHNALTELPPELGNLRNLRRLYLDHNFLSTLPPEIGHLRNLRLLKPTFNQLTSLPSEIEKLRHLRYFNVSYNFLSEIPWEVGTLRQLRKLYFGYNEISELPPWLLLLPSLEVLWWEGNP